MSSTQIKEKQKKCGSVEHTNKRKTKKNVASIFNLFLGGFAECYGLKENVPSPGLDQGGFLPANDIEWSPVLSKKPSKIGASKRKITRSPLDLFRFSQVENVRIDLFRLDKIIEHLLEGRVNVKAPLKPRVSEDRVALRVYLFPR